MPKLKDVDSGEMYVVGVIKRPTHKQQFTMVFCESLAALITDEHTQLSQLQWKLLMHIVASIEYENVLDQSVTEISRAISHDRSSVSRALRDLEAHELIYREDPRGSRPRRILLDPHLAFRGSEPRRKQMLKQGWPPRP